MNIVRFLLFFLCVSLTGCSKPSIFTDEEKEYIASKEVTWVIYNTGSNIPYLVSQDYFALFSKKTGLKFKLVAECMLPECVARMKDNQADILPLVRPTPERSVYLDFSNPYVFSHAILLKRINVPVTVGISRGTTLKKYISEERKDLQVIEFENDEFALQAMIDGEIDSAMMEEKTCTSLTKKFKVHYQEVRIPFDYYFSFAVAKGTHKVLLDILNKSIRQVTPEERLEITSKWQ